MDYNSFMDIHFQFDIKMLKQLILVIGLHEFIDVYKSIDPVHFTSIGDIYNNTFMQVYPYSFNIKDTGINIMNVLLLLFIIVCGYQSNLILFNPSFAEEQLRSRNINRAIPLTYEDLYNDTKNIISFLKFIRLFNVLQLLHLYRNYLYPGNEFHMKLIDNLSSHIMLQLKDDTELLLILHNLLNNTGLC